MAGSSILGKDTTTRVGLDLGKKRYGHQQQPAVIPADEPMARATMMSDDEFDRRYLAIVDELTRQGKPLHNPDMPACQEKKAREAAAT